MRPLARGQQRDYPFWAGSDTGGLDSRTDTHNRGLGRALCGRMARKLPFIGNLAKKLEKPETNAKLSRIKGFLRLCLPELIEVELRRL